MESGYIGSVEWCTKARYSGEHTVSCLENSRAALKREDMNASALLVSTYQSK